MADTFGDFLHLKRRFGRGYWIYGALRRFVDGVGRAQSREDAENMRNMRMKFEIADSNLFENKR